MKLYRYEILNCIDESRLFIICYKSISRELNCMCVCVMVSLWFFWVFLMLFISFYLDYLYEMLICLEFIFVVDVGNLIFLLKVILIGVVMLVYVWRLVYLCFCV